jgi:ABC-type lipoprotein export system ATPase subunit
LLHLLGGLDRPTHGCLRYEGEDLGSTSEAQLTKFRQLEFGFVFQQFHLIPTLTAQQQVEAALVAVGVSRSERRLRAMELLGRVGLTNRAHHLPGRLSGGEMQRVGIARALANEPHVLLADEPTGNLDTRTGEQILDLLLGALDGDRILVLVTHDDKMARKARRVIELEDGRVISDSVARSLARNDC